MLAAARVKAHQAAPDRVPPVTRTWSRREAISAYPRSVDSTRRAQNRTRVSFRSPYIVCRRRRIVIRITYVAPPSARRSSQASRAGPVVPTASRARPSRSTRNSCSASVTISGGATATPSDSARVSTPWRRASSQYSWASEGFAARASPARATAAIRPTPPRTSSTSGWVSRPASRAWKALDLPRSEDEVVGCKQVEVGQSGRTARRVTAVGDAMGEGGATLLEERRCDCRGHNHPAKWEVAAGNALGEHDHVRLKVPALDAQPCAETTEGVDDRIGDREHAVAPTDITDPLEVPVGRNSDATRCDHRLEYERRHAAGPETLDLGLQRIRRIPRHADCFLNQRAEPLCVRHPHDARPDAVRAVVGIRSADHETARRFASHHMEQTGELHPVSIASPPPLTRNTFESALGLRPASRSASCSAGPFVNSPKV